MPATSPEPELVVTKLWPPAVRPLHVPRDRSLSLLRAGEGLTLTLVDAPAGSGKTTALAQWYAAEDGRRARAWFSLDRTDNDPTRFWTYVILAIRRDAAGFGEAPLAALKASADVRAYVLPSLVNELAALGSDVALVLDDYHLITNPAIHDQVEQLLEHLPPSVQVVLATRADPPLPLSRWRGRGELAEIRAAHLRFSTDEADSMFGRMALAIDGDDVDRLVQRTEGWAAGLSMAGISLTGHDDAGAFVEAFAGTDRHVVDYLASEVLARQPADVQAFLVRCSVLNRFSGELCDAVLDRHGSGRLLNELERSNAFVVPLGDGREWYRFHHLFAEVLAGELHHEAPQLAPVLHARASDWYAERGMTFEALEHAVEAGDPQRVAELLMPVTVLYLADAQTGTVLSWLRRLGEHTVAADPRLSLIAATASLVHGDGAETLRWCRLAEMGRYDGPLPGGPASIEAGVATVAGIITTGRLSAHLAAARRAVALSREDTSPWRPLAEAALGDTLYWSGAFEDARAPLEIAARQGAPLLRATTYGLLGCIAVDLGDPAAAERLAAEGQQIAVEHRVETTAPHGRVLVALGRARAARGDWARAAGSLEPATELLRGGPYPYELADALLWLAQVRHAAGAPASGRAALLEAVTIIDRLEEPGILALRRRETEALLAGRSAPHAELGSVTDEELSTREQEILAMLPSALSEAEIGRALFISHHTVHSHVRAIYRKLGTTSRAQTVERARASGLLLG